MCPTGVNIWTCKTEGRREQNRWIMLLVCYIRNSLAHVTVIRVQPTVCLPGGKRLPLTIFPVLTIKVRFNWCSPELTLDVTDNLYHYINVRSRLQQQIFIPTSEPVNMPQNASSTGRIQDKLTFPLKNMDSKMIDSCKSNRRILSKSKPYVT
jgi:hypothetical protein